MTKLIFRKTPLVYSGLFILLVLGVSSNSALIHYLDNAIFNLVAMSDSHRLTTFMIYVSSIASPLIVSVLATILLILNRHQLSKSIYLATFYFGTSTLALLLKHLVHRTRPHFQLFPDTGFSFPSGHSICMILFYQVLLVLLADRKDTSATLMRWGALLMTLALLFSRVYLRDHFPTDILGSLCLAMASYSFFQPLFWENRNFKVIKGREESLKVG